MKRKKSISASDIAYLSTNPAEYIRRKGAPMNPEAAKLGDIAHRHFAKVHHIKAKAFIVVISLVFTIGWYYVSKFN